MSYLLNGGRVLVIGSRTAEIFRKELGISSSVIKPKGPAFISIPGRIGSVRSEIIDIKLEAGGKPLGYFFRGSDFRDPDDVISASVSRAGKGMIAGIYFNAGTSYIEYKTPVIRDFIAGVIKELNPPLAVSVQGSGLVHMALNRLNGRLYVNLINTAGEHTNQSAIGYDEIPVLYNIKVKVSTGSKPRHVKLQPGGKALRFSYDKGQVSFILPVLELHSVIEIY